jgi:type II secretory pathway component PulK
MKLSLHHWRSSGMALIIVMIAVLVLSCLAAGFAYSMKVEDRLAFNAKEQPDLTWLGRSGVELARWVLAQEAMIPGEPYDALNQIWAGGPGGLGETNSPLAGIDLTHYPIADGWVSLKIIDLERYANINSAGEPVIRQALTLMGVDADQISVISDSIEDWVTPGNLPRIAGAKSDYYEGLNPPYECKSAPMDDISELLLVRGIWDHPEIYDPQTYGGQATGRNPFHHQLGFGAAPGQTPNYPFGLKDVFTAISRGQVNVNTAGRNVLQLLLMSSGMDMDSAGNMADAIIQYRAGPDGQEGTEDDTPFLNPNQLSAAGVPPQAVGALSRFCTVRSSTFKVTVTAHLGNLSHEYTAILFRNGPNNVQVVSFYWEN